MTHEEILIQKYAGATKNFSFPFAIPVTGTLPGFDQISYIDSIDNRFELMKSNLPAADPPLPDGFFAGLFSAGAVNFSKVTDWRMTNTTSYASVVSYDSNIAKMMNYNILNAYRLGGYSLVCKLRYTNYFETGVAPLATELRDYAVLLESNGFTQGMTAVKRINARTNGNMMPLLNSQGMYIFESDLFILNPLSILAFCANAYDPSFIHDYNSVDVYGLIPNNVLFTPVKVTGSIHDPRYFQQGSPENLKTNNVVL